MAERREAQGPDRRPRRGPRWVAFEVLRTVADADAYANLILPQRIRDAGLDERDAALATELTYGTLRRLGYYDRIITLAADRDTSRIDPAALDLLRLGAHQLLGMRVAPHAAVKETVALVRKESARGFVNAVLRRIAAEDRDTWLAATLAGVTSGEEALSIQYAHPLWIVRAMRQVLVAEGREAELESLLVADNVPAPVALTALPGLAAPEELGERLSSVSPVGVLAPSGDPGVLPAVREARARVQDEGSALAALILSRARPIVPGERWLDLCAGPGGKAALLAAEAAIGGAELTANEFAPHRAELVRRALRVFGEAAPEVVVADGATWADRAPAAFDRILLDAPCTGLGALRRRPEARWRKQPSDVAELAGLQSRLLDAAIAALRPGGLLAYVTCSPHAAETKAIVNAALRRHAGLRSLDTQEVAQRVAVTPLDLAPGTHVQLWPHRHGTDAMFIQLLTVE